MAATQIHRNTPQSQHGVRQQAGQVVERAEDVIGEHALSSVALCLGLGFGVGVLIGASLAYSRPWREPDPSFTERYGRQFVDAVQRLVPDSLSWRS